MKRSPALLCAFTASLLFPWSARSATSDAEALFVRGVLPLFQEKCLACHGQDEKKIKGGLDMRTSEALRKGGDSEEPSVVAGQPEKSPLYL